MLFQEEKTKIIIGCFYHVYNTLGFGFLEKVYENSLSIELKETGFNCFAQAPVNVFYKDEIVGAYFADLLIDNEIIVEVKAGSGEILSAHEKQLSNYLKATDFELGFVFHFGEKPAFKRIIFNNEYK